MIEINGIKFLEGSDKFREVRARTAKDCDLCGQGIHEGEVYYRYIEKATGWEKKACLQHVDKDRVSQFESRRQKYIEKRRRGQEVRLETDASGPEGERWAFIAYINGREILRERGYTPPEISSITPAEGYAILMAIESLQKVEKKGLVKADLPLVIGSDNYAVASKLGTQSERGKYKWLWARINEVLSSYRGEGRLFVEPGYRDNAHDYAQKWE